jgi:DNA-binding PadR family transcriptional regulator
MGRKNNLDLNYLGLENSKPYLRLKKSFTLSTLWLYILSLASKQKIYAYSLSNEIKNRFDFEPSLLWVYLVLYKLEKEGYLKAVFKKKRKYYYITKKGKKLLELGKDFIKKIYDLL